MNKFTPKAEDDKKIKKDLESKIVGLGQASFNSSDNKANKPKTILSRPPQVSSGIGNLAQILTVESESALQAPHQEIIEKINVIFNSMSKNNIADKSNELKMLLTNENTLRWFSNFFILNRVSVENNNHPIYNELITLIDLKELNQLLIKDTISFIKKLLVSENLAKDPREKNVLKNLGSWLGIMTLAKNKPILAKDLDLKEIIFEAYENGKLGAIIIFVGRILEHSAKTKVFHAKNPWIQAILSLLAELNFKPFLKHNMKFEIENIFKKLEVELSNYPQSRLLDAIIVCQNSLDFTKPQTAVVNEPQIESFNLQELIGRISSLDQYVSDVMSFLINKIPSHIQISKSDIVTILTNSLANAINEILNPVVERAVNISQVTTRELVLKDFACERDDAKFKNAANLCIKALAGSLAMVTCKEPLRIGYNNQLKEFLTKKGIENEIIEALNNTLNNTEILEIGCNFIQSYVIKRAVDKIERDKIIIDEMDKRKKNKIIEAKPDLITKIKTLPEILRPNPSGLTADQYKIYEDFEHAYDSTSKYENNGGNNKITVLKMIVPALREVLDSYSSSTPQTRIINKYEFCMFNIQFIAKRNESAELAEEDEQIGILSKIIYDAKISDVTLASELANCTYKYVINESKVHNLSLVNIYSEILKGWVKLHPQLSKEITNKLLNSEDIQSRFKFEVHYYLIKKHLIDMGTYETILADYLEEVSMNNEVRKLITNLIRRNALTLTHFKRIPIYMIDPTLNYWEIFGKKHTVQQSAPSIIDFKICNIKDISTFQRFAEMCKFAYNQMINAMYQNYDVEKVRIKLKDFIDSPFVKNEEQMNVFIMIITELAIKGELCYDPENNFYPESEARCIMGLLTIIPSTMNKLKIFENILFGIFKVFHYDYVKNTPNFNQKPYFKLLYNIIHYINGLEANDELFTGGYKKFQFFAIFADVLRVLNPLNYPGFGLAWLDLVSSKIFSGAFLEIDPSLRLKDHIPKYEKYLFIVIDTLSYLKSYNCDLLADYNSKTFVDQVYKLMYLISSSYPEFLSYYYYIILASLPAGDCYIQMKNIILHCAPSDIEQPNPFYDEFKVDSLPDIRKNSVVLFDIASILQEYGFKGMIDEYIETKSDATLDELLKKLNNNRKEKDQSQNYFIINAIVIYWSQNIIKTNSEKKMKNTEVLEFFIKMIRNLDNDNRDHLINSILNELRYPSNQTYYFSCLLLCIFFEIKNELIEEHILR